MAVAVVVSEILAVIGAVVVELVVVVVVVVDFLYLNFLKLGSGGGETPGSRGVLSNRRSMFMARCSLREDGPRGGVVFGSGGITLMLLLDGSRIFLA